MATPRTYQVISPGGATVTDAGSSTLHPCGSIFMSNPRNASIQALLSTRAVVETASVAQGSSSAARRGMQGRVGPRGPAGGPAGALYSVKIRTAPFTKPLTLDDSGGVSVLVWPVETEILYDEMGMFIQASDDEKVYAIDGGEGRYRATATIRFGNNTRGARYVEITQYDHLGVFKDSAAKTSPAANGLDTIIQVADDFDCVATDYFTVSYRQTSEVSLSGAASFSVMLMGSGDRGPQGDVGLTGEQGDAGPVGPRGAQGVAWRGAWSSEAEYDIGDGVVLDGRGYTALAQNQTDSPAASDNWLLISAKGDAGAPGEGAFVNDGLSGLTDRWLSAKSRLDALPPLPQSGTDTYALARARLTSQVQTAHDVAVMSGGTM